MKTSAQAILLCLTLLLAPIVTAAPEDGERWGGWWTSLVELLFGSTSADDDSEPPPDVAPEPSPTDSTSCSTCDGGGDTEAGPKIDPNG